MANATNLDQEAAATRMIVEAGGEKTFVLIGAVQGDSVRLTCAVSKGVTPRDVEVWLGALNHERERIAGILGIHPDSIETTRC